MVHNLSHKRSLLALKSVTVRLLRSNSKISFFFPFLKDIIAVYVKFCVLPMLNIFKIIIPIVKSNIKVSFL